MTCEQAVLLEQPKIRLNKVIEVAEDIRDVAKACHNESVVYATERVLAAAKGQKILPPVAGLA